ncbi:MAG: transposase [Parcubacteria group bacterium Gr01-1014_38]|nr:MAG: transposase [Parcubacteria group bacterium Gr01-1014_38]
MRVLRLSYGVRGFVRLSDYALRWSHMITRSATDRARILAFWERHGLAATQEAFRVSRRTLFLWKQQLREGGGMPEALNPKSTKPHTLRRRTAEWPPEVLAEIRRLREEHPNLGPAKCAVLLRPFCIARRLSVPSARTVARLIHDLGGLRLFPEKVRHDGRIVPRKREHVLRKPKGFHADYPGHLVTLDTIERFLHGTRRYLLTFTDTHSRFSFAWATRSHASQAAAEFFRLVRRVFPVPWVYVLSDNGSEFKKRFAAEVRNQHLTHWKTYPQCPRMNPHDERFNRTLQEEFVNYHAGLLLDVRRFNVRLVEHLLWHNTERPHHALGLKSPVQFLGEKYPEQCKMWWHNTFP